MVGLRNTVDLEVDPKETIGKIRERAATTQAVDADNVVLIHNDEPLDNDKRLKDYGIGEGETLELALKNPRGGRSPSSPLYKQGLNGQQRKIFSQRMSREAQQIRSQNLPIKPEDPWHWKMWIEARRGKWRGRRHLVKVKLHSRKRKGAPAHLMHPFATREFLETWNEYKHYRDSDDWSPEAPAVVQVDHGGMPVSVPFVRRMLKEYAALAGVDKRVTPHIVRKSGGTELSMKNPKLGQIQLGHRSIKTTLTNYTGPNEEDKMQINDILTPERKMTVNKIVEQLTQHFVKGELPEEEYLYAIKSLKNNHSINQEKNDMAFR